MYLLIDETDGFIEGKEGSRYLNTISTDSNNEVSKKYEEVWNGIRDCITKINDNKLKKYAKGYSKIKFDSNDNLPLNETVKFHILTIIIRNIFEKDGEYYPQMFLDDCLYEA